MNWKRFFYILVFNVLIATATTWLVLKVWEKKPQVESAATVMVTVLVTVPVPVPQTVIPTIPGTEITPEGFFNSGAPSETPIPLQAYIVQTGDILSKIAIQFHVSVDDILRANNLSDPNNIYVGQKLLIPVVPLPTETPAAPPTEIPTITPLPSRTATPTATPTTDTSPPRLVIESIQGAGILDSELVKIVHTGGGQAVLESWRLENGRGDVFTFPRLSLFPGAVVFIHSNKGNNSATDLYWNSPHTVWKSGDTAVLRDQRGNEIASYLLP